MNNNLATTVAEKIKLTNETTEVPTAAHKSNKFWLLAAVPAILAIVGCSYLFINRRWQR